jgi:hypothetical protein
VRKEVWHASRTYISRIELKYIAFAGRMRERNDITAYTCRTLNTFGVNTLKYAKIQREVVDINKGTRVKSK